MFSPILQSYSLDVVLEGKSLLHAYTSTSHKQVVWYTLNPMSSAYALRMHMCTWKQESTCRPQREFLMPCVMVCVFMGIQQPLMSVS